jgi:hypothetical protein
MKPSNPLIALFVLAAAVLPLLLACANPEPDRGSVPVAANATPGAEEAAAAEAFVRSSPDIERLVGSRPYLVSGAAFRVVAGHERTIAVRVSWAEPIELRARWLLLRCQGTRLYQPEVTWADVTMLEVVVDLEGREVVGLGVTSYWRDDQPMLIQPHLLNQPPPGGSILSDVRSGKVIASGSYAAITKRADDCPAGLDDD